MIIIFVTILVIACARAEDPIGIIDGDLTSWEEYPFMGSLITKDNKYLCPVSRMRNTFMMTAACIIDRDFSNCRVRFGSSFYNREGHVYKIKTVMIHPDYTRNETHDDLALVTLREPIVERTVEVQMSAPERKFFPFPDLDSKLPPELGPVFIDGTESGKSDSPRITALFVLGWGITHLGSNIPSEQLRLAYIGYELHPRVCEEEYNMTLDAAKIFCFKPANVSQSPCIGDIGAPLIFGRRMYFGLLTMTPATCDGAKPSIFLNLSPYMTWIFNYAE